MNRQEEILTLLQEECAEVIQAVSKVRRFGLDNNINDLKKEIADVLCMIDILLTSNIIIYEEEELDRLKYEKTIKLKKYSKIFQHLMVERRVYLNKVKEKVSEQDNLLSYSDNFNRYLFSNEEHYLNSQELRAKNVFMSLTNKRYQTYKERVEDTLEWPDDPRILNYYLQGVISSTKWKDTPVMKTATDLAVLNMLIWELKPGCIVELGSGNGSSAEYLSDITKIFNLDTQIVSFDIRPVTKKYERVNYFHGDCNSPDTFDCIKKFIDKDKPTLFIEDAHVNVSGTLKKLLTFAKPGDYFFVEDSATKQEDLKKILDVPGLYLDRHYLDFFGKNSSSSTNGIFKVTVDFLG